MKDTRKLTAEHAQKLRQVSRVLREIYYEYPLESDIAIEIKLMDGLLWEFIDEAENGKTEKSKK
jgi:hypothetical protein